MPDLQTTLQVSDSYVIDKHPVTSFPTIAVKHGAASKVSTFVLQHVFCEVFGSLAWLLNSHRHTNNVLWSIVGISGESVRYTLVIIPLAALLCCETALASALTGSTLVKNVNKCCRLLSL